MSALAGFWVAVGLAILGAYIHGGCVELSKALFFVGDKIGRKP